MLKMLLHTCCGPCSIYPMQQVQGDFVVTNYFFNPNIHPYKEFTRRLQTLREYAQKKKFSLEIDKTYCLEEFLAGCLQTSNRCEYCYEVRMRKTAVFARDNGFDCFSTSLLVSPFQKHELLKSICEEVACSEGVDFYYQDWRIGFEQGQQEAREREMYLQGYCGCVFSERDRYMKK